jgi:hypothetical protein
MGEVEPVQVHDLVPGRHEVANEPLPGVGARVDLGDSTELGAGPETRSTAVAVHLTSPVVWSRPW